MNKQTRTSHPRRAELERFLREGTERIARHLEGCQACSTAVNLLRSFGTVRAVEDRYGHSESLVQRLASIPALATGPARRPLAATPVTDSWHGSALSAVRNNSHGVERRLRYRVRDLLIDLVVERLGDKVECFLRISRRGLPAPRFALALGNKRLLPADIGFFAWTDIRPPRTLVLWSPEISVSLESIQW